MKHFFILLIGSLLFITACSEDDGIVGTRYVDDIFSTVNEIGDIQYGENAGLSGTSRGLFLNIFEPVGDNLAERPTIVLAHGGAFISGTRFRISELCEAYAKKGFVAVTIDYRLINDPSVNDAEAFSEGVVLTIGDMKAAIRYLRNDALNGNTYGIDPDLIFAGGVSAGAVIANHIGYLDESDDIPQYLLDHLETHGGFEGNSNEIEASSAVAGVVSFSGSLFDESWVNAGDPPLFAVHEELDPVVPCGFDASDIFPFEIFAYGGCSLSDRAEEVGVLNEFILYEGDDNHVGYLQDENTDAMINASAEFLAGIIANQ